jgi:hypothetical protein
VLTEEERQTLTRWAQQSKSAQALALRSRIVLGCAEGLSNKEVAARERWRRGRWASGGAGSSRRAATGWSTSHAGPAGVVTAEQVVAAVVLRVDEKSQIQALALRQPAFPMMPGMPEKRTHDYVRHGTTSLFAAFDTSDGTVITALHRRHRAIEFRKFVATIAAQVPVHLDVHLVCDNYGTHKAPTKQSWLDHHPRFHLHYTPTYSSWINRSNGVSPNSPNNSSNAATTAACTPSNATSAPWITAWNDNPKPYVWTKTADQIPAIRGVVGA